MIGAVGIGIMEIGAVGGCYNRYGVHIAVCVVKTEVPKSPAGVASEIQV